MKNKYGFQNSCMGFSFYQLKLSVNQLSGITVLKCPFKRVIFHEMFNGSFFQVFQVRHATLIL
jgi:hypothetical protein